MKRIILTCALILSITLPFASCGEDTGGSEAVNTSDVEIESVEYASMFEGHKLTMINVWATFCGPCINEMPDLGEIASEYADKGLQIVGIPADVLSQDGSISEEMVATAKEIVAATGANYLHILPQQTITRCSRSRCMCRRPSSSMRRAISSARAMSARGARLTGRL